MKKKIIWILAFIIFIVALVFINDYLKNKDIGVSSIQNSESVTNYVNHDESLAGEYVIQVTSSNFDEVVLNSGKTVLVDFYADWCPPCKMLSPLIDEVARENTEESIVFTRINVDEEEALSNQYGIYSIPTLVLIKNGQEIDRSIGYIEKEEIISLVNQ